MSGVLEVLDHGGPVGEEAGARRGVGHEGVFIRAGLDVLVGERVVAAELGDDVAARDEGGELVDSFGEVDFAGDDGVEPAFDDGPDAWMMERGWVRGVVRAF